jgi:hypothetical protein
MSSRKQPKELQFIIIICIVCLHLVSATIAPRPGSSWSGGSSSSKGKKSYYAGPRPGFTGGQALNNNRPRWCTSPDLPGCQACYDGRCTACWSQYPNTTGTSYGLGPPGGSRFVLNLATGQCSKYPTRLEFVPNSMPDSSRMACRGTEKVASPKAGSALLHMCLQARQPPGVSTDHAVAT